MGMEKMSVEWHAIRVCLQWKWPELNKEDLNGGGRSEEELISVLESRTGESRENLMAAISGYRTAMDFSCATDME